MQLVTASGPSRDVILSCSSTFMIRAAPATAARMLSLTLALMKNFMMKLSGNLFGMSLAATATDQRGCVLYEYILSRLEVLLHGGRHWT